MDWLNDPQAWIGLLTLTVLEIVLGIDNIVFISILSGKLPKDQQRKARQIGLAVALITRILLLFSLGLVMSLTQPIFRLGPPPVHPVAAAGHGPEAHIADPWGFSGRDLILILGGLFLLWKAVHEIHQKLEGEEGHVSAKVAPSFSAVIFQIMMLDVVFSLDSVITAIGMVKQIAVMVIAVLIAVGVMLAFVNTISDFVERHPTVKMLALAFLVLIGVNILAEGFEQHIERGYIYFAMAFSVMVEVLNLRTKKHQPVHLHQAIAPEESERAGNPS